MYYIIPACVSYILNFNILNNKQVYGGSVFEAMNDLVYLMSKLADVNGKILIPGVNDSVAKVSFFVSSLKY